MDEEKTLILRKMAAALPDGPGVYFFKNAVGALLYVGKAKSLRKRVSSYFSGPHPARTAALVGKTERIDFVTTGSEREADLLEASIIKEKQPHYNVSRKDDKTFPFISIGGGDFPAVMLVRRRGKPEAGAGYYGPYTDAAFARSALKIVRRLFGFRSCAKLPKEPCLYSRLGLCPVPCAGRISPEDYAAVIRRVKLFLEGNYEILIADLSARMEQAAGEKDFEAAAGLRDQISALSAMRAGGSRRELDDLKRRLRLKSVPERIEAFDISCIQGRESCGSLVSFNGGGPDKHNYRRFRIKQEQGMNDFAMMKEVVFRRYSRLLRENLPLPDLIIIDGGRGQVSSALSGLSEAGVFGIPLIGIAKPERGAARRGRSARSMEKVCFADGREMVFSGESAGLNLLRRIRDEAHRFAVSYHRLLRNKRMLGK